MWTKKQIRERKEDRHYRRMKESNEKIKIIMKEKKK